MLLRMQNPLANALEANESAPIRHLIVVLGDQLDPASQAFEDFDAARDVIWMAEVRAESTHVWSHKARTALFFTAMRHFASAQRALGRRVDYWELPRSMAAGFEDLVSALTAGIHTYQPQRVVWVKPGDYRVETELKAALKRLLVPLIERADTHFLVDLEDFFDWAKGRREFRLEHFYRLFRKKLDVLMEAGEPVGGQWNFDAENRKSFGRKGPGVLPTPKRFAPDEITQAAIADVERYFPEHPGSTASFAWPVTPEQANAALDDFIQNRLAQYGVHQDAMWSDAPWLHHALISSALNLKLLHPMRVVRAAEAAFHQGLAPIAAVEGFIRQVLGWREFVRGLYWWRMPKYLSDNALNATLPLPDFFWTGKTDMRCMEQVLGQTLEHGYAHHIQRLMVTGNFALLLGVQPQQVHAWYLAVYVDAVEWVEMPNTLGMSQFADGGVIASKPYCASGKYIERMSNYCQGCRYQPELSTGASACPFTTLYWDFLERHADRFAKHPRSALQWRSRERLSSEQRAAIKAQAERLRLEFCGLKG